LAKPKFIIIGKTRLDAGVGKDVVQIGMCANGTPTKWSFTEITRNSFHWLGEVLNVDGHTWTLEFVAGANGDLDWIIPDSDADSVKWTGERLWQLGAHLMGSSRTAIWPQTGGLRTSLRSTDERDP
jgi:hypothetical protein